MWVKNLVVYFMEDFDFDPMFGDVLTVGDSVPENITFPVFKDGDLSELSFSDLRGKWVILFFYPADFTFVCPTELGEMADLYETFKAEDTEVISVSTDTAFVHKAWSDASDTIKKIKYPMGADAAHVMSRMFGVLDEETGLAKRGTFIISPDGDIMTAEIHSDAIGRSGKETLRKLKAAKYVNQHPNNVCPASWDEGAETLTPGVDLVGKI